MPDLDSFEVFLAVAEIGSIGGAARALGLTQQAVSRRLALMESRAGMALATRNTRGTELTPAGKFVFDCARRLLDVARDIDANLGALRVEHHEQIYVMASPTVAEFLMPLWMLSLQLTEAQEGHPMPKVILAASTSSEVIASVREGKADLGFVENPGTPVGLGHCVVGQDKLVVVVRPDHHWARRSRTVRAEELAATALVSREAGVGIRDSLTLALRRALGPDVNHPPLVLELPSMGAMRAAVLAGAGPAVMSRLSVSDDLAAGRLHEIQVPGLDLRRQFRAIWQGGRNPPVGGVRRLLAHIGESRQGAGHRNAQVDKIVAAAVPGAP